jgi:pimeloyl-ACP methyl ester carboxylesterase
MLRRVSVFLLLFIALLAAFWLAVRRDDIPYGALEARYATEDSEFITLIDGLVVHYTAQGPENAPVILLLHGFASSSLTWADWQTDLKSDYRVISADLPGHGLTRNRDDQYLSSEGLAQYVDDLVIALGLNDFVLVGSSMGGHAAWLYAADHPSSLRGLVLVAGAGLPETAGEPDEPLLFRVLDYPLFRPLLEDIDPSPLVRSGLRGAFVDAGFATNELVKTFSDLARAPGHRRALMKLAGRSRDTADADAQRLSELDFPVLILHGEDDRIVPVDHAARFEDLIPDAELKIYPGTGHLPHQELAAETLSEFRGFLMRIYPARSPGAYVSAPVSDARAEDVSGPENEKTGR